MILYWAKSTCAFAPHVVLEELGVPFEPLEIDPTVPRPPQYLKLYPRGHVPLLVDGDFVLAEAHAICVYLCDLHPKAGLIPAAGTHERARCHELAGVLSSAVHVAYRQIRRPARFTDDESAFDGIRKHGRGYLSRLFGELDQRIAGKPWAIGEQYTFVDPYLMIMKRWGHTAELDMTPFTNLNAHTQRMLARPAVQRVIQREGTHPWP